MIAYGIKNEPTVHNYIKIMKNALTVGKSVA